MRRIVMVVLCFVIVSIGATKYYDVGASGANDGSSQTDAWQTLQAAADGAVAGDSVLCKIGTETLTSPVTLDVNSGNNTSGFITFFSVNSSWVDVDSVYSIIDANGAAASCLATITSTQVRFKGFRFTGATGDNIDGSSGGDFIQFFNCVIDSAGDDGVSGTVGCDNWLFYQCTFRANVDAIFQLGNYTKILFCKFELNTGLCYDVFYEDNNEFIGNLFTKNATPIIEIDDRNLVFGNVFDSSNSSTETAISALSTGNSNIIICNRFTNTSTAINAGSRSSIILGNNTFWGNTADTSNASLIFEIANGASTTNFWNSSDADDGYVDPSSGNWNLKDGRDGRRVAHRVGATW